MKNFITTFQAIDKTDGILKTFAGQTILANDFQEAETICKENFPYLCVNGELISELDSGTLLNNDTQLN